MIVIIIKMSLVICNKVQHAESAYSYTQTLFRLPYLDLFGGVCAISITQMQKVNGFSNFYFGWGGEDDDMSKRLRHHGYHIFRYPSMIGAYKMIKHNGDSGNAANTWR